MKHGIPNVAYTMHLCFTSSSVQCPVICSNFKNNEEDVFHAIASLHIYMYSVSFNYLQYNTRKSCIASPNTWRSCFRCNTCFNGRPTLPHMETLFCGAKRSIITMLKEEQYCVTSHPAHRRSTRVCRARASTGASSCGGTASPGLEHKLNSNCKVGYVYKNIPALRGGSDAASES
jgi:hypothetical protein